MRKPERPQKPAHKPAQQPAQKHSPRPEQRHAPRSSRPPAGGTEILYGLRSALSVFERRRQDIRHIGFDAGLRAELSELVRWAESSGVSCREEDERELAARAQSNQHEGVVLDVLPRRWLPAKELAAELARNPGIVVALDRVRNPQNIGAVLRSAAFFGVKAVVLGTPAPHPGLAPFALRVAEGGAEHLALCRTTDLAETLGRLQAQGVQIIGADAHATSSLDTIEVPGACVLVLGHEREGLGPRVKAKCNSLVSIQGSGSLESLNVAVAAGVLLAALWQRQRRAPPRAPSAGGAVGVPETVQHRR
jgi:TrmH RNA methyltransferase